MGLPVETPGLLKLCKFVSEVEQVQKDAYVEEYTKRTDISPTWSLIVNRQKSKQQTSGDKKIRGLISAFDTLDGLGYKRSETQRLFHKSYIAACLKKIYGPDIYRDIARLLEEYNLEELKSDVIVTTPRRHGKTISVALFIAACLFVLPDFEISVYSTGRRASRKLLAQVHKMVTLLAGTHDIVQVYNQEALEVKGTGIGNSKCFSYPSKVQID